MACRRLLLLPLRQRHAIVAPTIAPTFVLRAQTISLPRTMPFATSTKTTMTTMTTKASTTTSTTTTSTVPTTPTMPTPVPPCSKPQGEKLKRPASLLEPSFWKCRHTWKRACVNTLRCLVGCSVGDFSAMWLLQMHYPELGMGWIMPISMASGISTSIFLESVLLRTGRDKLAWPEAVKTAVGMSFISMLTMEAAENLVDYQLTGGWVAFDSAWFWLAAIISMAAGFAAPLPYNYIRLRKYGKSCH
ncbi:hypothetical protein BGZ63DRAFT_395839 [Mariannaea sp. PMI_226]|nr:hypothetical protein BGZ63DRAFT_395839 [Mariannaea sp. PMI_226]